MYFFFVLLLSLPPDMRAFDIFHSTYNKKYEYKDVKKRTHILLYI